MSEQEYQRIFSFNLKRIMNDKGKSQIDIIRDLGFNKSSVSTWVNGTRLPRMDKVDALAKYFGVKRSDLLEQREHGELSLSFLEEEMVLRFRQLSETEQNMVLRMLGIEEKMAESDSA